MSHETFTFTAATSYEGLTPITQAYGVCLDEQQRVLLQKHPDRPWNIPGGKPEAGETYEQAVIREVFEETNVWIENPRMIGYQEYFKDGIFQSYQLRFLATVTSIEDRQPDPDEGVLRERMFVPLSEAMQHIPYSQYEAMFTLVEQLVQ